MFGRIFLFLILFCVSPFVLAQQAQPSAQTSQTSIDNPGQYGDKSVADQAELAKKGMPDPTVQIDATPIEEIKVPPITFSGDGPLPDWVTDLTPGKLFADLPGICATARRALVAIAFVLCVCAIAFSGRTEGSGRRLVENALRPAMCAMFVCLSPFVLSLVQDFGRISGSSLGVADINGTTGKMLGVASAMLGAKSASDPVFTREELDNIATNLGKLNQNDAASIRSQIILYQQALAKKQRVVNATAPGGSRAAAMRELQGDRAVARNYVADKGLLKGPTVADKAKKLLKFSILNVDEQVGDLISFLIVIVINFLLTLAAVLTVLAWSLQAFLVQLSSVLLPVAIAMLCVRQFSQSGMTYISNVVGLCLWPFSWALAGIGTAALTSWVIRVMLAGVVDERAMALLTSSRQVPMSEWQGVMDQIVNYGGDLTWAYVKALVPIVILICWVLGTTIYGPKVIMGFVQGGANPFTGMMSSAGMAAGGAAAAMKGVFGGSGGGGGGDGSSRKKGGGSSESGDGSGGSSGGGGESPGGGAAGSGGAGGGTAGAGSTVGGSGGIGASAAGGPVAVAAAATAMAAARIGKAAGSAALSGAESAGKRLESASSADNARRLAG